MRFGANFVEQTKGNLSNHILKECNGAAIIYWPRDAGCADRPSLL
jgi:hypothetical protein